MKNEQNIIQKIGAFVWDKLNFRSTPRSEARHRSSSTGTFNHLFAWSYDGEKNLGELNPPKNYLPDYQMLRIRSWQSYLESELSQTILNRFTTWVIGTGLKLQAEPSEIVLKSENVTLDVSEFRKQVEAYFKVFAASKQVDYASMSNLGKIGKRMYKNAIIGGDVLVVLRYDRKADNISVELIDGAHIQSPGLGSDFFPQVLANGNTIKNGVEQDKTGKHIRYHIRQADHTFKAINAFGIKSGLQMATLVYGTEYRLDNNRGLPLISVVLESLSKLERYKEATVGSAEERQKIPYSIEHTKQSDGENPLLKSMVKATNINGDSDQFPADDDGVELQNTIAATVNKQVINLPLDASLKMLESKNELYFKDFYTVNIEVICAALNIPPEVAMSRFASNYSASRAALKDWEHSLITIRHDFGSQFYQVLYDFWLEINIQTGRIKAPGYLEASNKKDNYVLTAYRSSRWVGASVPHIDPLKEVKAERAKLGTAFDHVPLTSPGQSAEDLNSGELSTNIKRSAEELEQAEKAGIKSPAATVEDPAATVEALSATVEDLVLKVERLDNLKD